MTVRPLTTERPLAILWLGASGDEPGAPLNRRCVEVLARRSDLAIVTEGEWIDVVVMTAGSQPETPARRYLHLPLTADFRLDMIPAVGWLPAHRRWMPPNTPYLPLPDLADGDALWDAWASAFADILLRTLAPPARIRLSACVLATGDPEALALTLARIRGSVDELVVFADPDAVDLVSPLADRFGARLQTVSPWSYLGAKQAAGSAATGDWILWLEAGEYVADGHDNLRRIGYVPPQGEDVCLLDLYDGLAPELGPIRAPRLIANHHGLAWRGALSEGLATLPTGAVIEARVALGGVAAASRPELRGASARWVAHMLHRALSLVPEHPHLNRYAADLYQRRGAGHAASRHYAVTMAFHGVHGSWPEYVKETAEARIRFAWEQGFYGLLHEMLRLYGLALQGWAPFWLYRGLLDRREGRLEDAAGAVAKGWELVAQPRFHGYKGPLALLAAAVCAETGRFEAAVAWLSEVAKASGTAPALVAGWCRWLADRGHAGEAQMLADAQGIEDWGAASAREPDWPQAAVAGRTLTVCLVVDGSAPLATRSLPMFSELADELLVIAPVGSEALTVAAAHAAKCVAIEGDVAQANLQAVLGIASGDWLLVAAGHEWPDSDAVAALRGWLANAPTDHVGTLDVHPVIEWPVADLGEAGLPRLADRRRVRRLRQEGGNWILDADGPQTDVAGAFLWREGGKEGTGPMALAAGKAMLAAGELDAAAQQLAGLIAEDRRRSWPSPWLWSAWESLADVRLLQGQHVEAASCLRHVAQCRPILARPELAGVADPTGDLPLLADPAGLQSAQAIVQAFVAGRVREAVRLAELAVQDDPASACYWGLLAQVRLEASDLVGAESAARRCLLLRPRLTAIPEWFPDLGTLPETWLGRIWLATEEPYRALGWLVPQLTRPDAPMDWVVFALAAAWQCREAAVITQIVSLFAGLVSDEERTLVDAALAAAAIEYGWPAASLSGWLAWGRAPAAGVT